MPVPNIFICNLGVSLGLAADCSFQLSKGNDAIMTLIDTYTIPSSRLLLVGSR